MLAPLLVLQGIGVRRRTPRLHEPPGPRSGRLGTGPPLRLLIAGDSAAAGVGASSQAEGLAGRVAAALAGDFEVHWRLLARTGMRTRQLAAMLATSPASRYDVALLSAGVNDVTGGTRSFAFLQAQRELVALLRSRFRVGFILLTGLPPMHAFPALPQPLRWVLGERARRFTALLATLSAGETDCELLVPPLPIDLAYIASDGFHPGPLAYELWGREAASRIRRWQQGQE